ncbi:MAG: TlpA family protein disulfide reductase [Deltaproteobacteria bacterium]|nr:TlpA family protein disulfide reductase [Deltaproteobacteria bacterium]
MRADASVHEGDAFPSLSLTDWNGQATTFAAAGDEVVVVEFWASWCVPCHDALPALARLAAQYEGKHLTVVLINIDAERAIAERKLSAVLSDHTRLVLLSDSNGEAMASVGAPGMPSTYIVSGGVISKILVGFGPAEHEAIDNAVRDAAARPK